MVAAGFRAFPGFVPRLDRMEHRVVGITGEEMVLPLGGILDVLDAHEGTAAGDGDGQQAHAKLAVGTAEEGLELVFAEGDGGEEGFSPSWAARTAQAMVKEEKISTIVLSAPSRLSR